MLKSFAQEQIRLVKEEQQVNVENSHKLLAGSVGELQRLGHALVNLTVSAVRAGLGSKTNMSFSNSITGLDLAQNNFKLGDVVAVEEHGKAAHGQTPASTGIVSAVGDKQISVDVKMDVPEYRLFRLIKLANSVSYERIIESLTKLSDTIEPYSDLYSVLLGMKEPTFIDEPVEILDVELNPSQRAACVHAVSANQIALIHGPPGTGKTHTSIEIIRQAVARNQKVLVCAPSNIAVDNIAERLMAYKIRAVRIGHSSRMVNAVAPCSLDYQLKYSDNGLILNDARAALDGTLKKMLCAKKREKRELHIEMKELRKEVRLRQTNVLAGILRNAEVVLATLNTAASKMLKQTHFDLVIIDEVSQALEAECWIAIQKARRCVLVGDPLQLAPTVMKQNSSLSVTMFYRLNKRYPQLTRLLDTQYRMVLDN